MFLVVIVLICALFVLWIYGTPRRRSPPLCPGGLPIIGHAHLLLGDALQMWQKEKLLYQFCLENGGIVDVRFGPIPVTVITDLEDSLTIANTCFDKPYVYNFGKELYGRGLVTANASIWKPHRKLLNPAFSQRILNTFIKEFSTQAKRFVSELVSEVGKYPFDVTPYLLKYTLRTVYKQYGYKIEEDKIDVTLLGPQLCLSKERLNCDNDCPQHLLASVRERFWAVGGRCLARSTTKQCVICVRLRGHTVQPLMGNLPAERSYSSYPFYSCGVDFDGPFMVSSRKETTIGVVPNDDQEVTITSYTHATDSFFASILERVQKIWLHLPFIFNMSSIKKKQDIDMKTVKEITKGIIIKRKSELKQNIYSGSIKEATSGQSLSGYESLLDQMLNSAIEQDAFTDEEIREHLDTIIGAAYDTTTSALTFSLILIGSYPDVQERIFKELQGVLDDQDIDLTKHDLPKLVYLEAVVKETLRLYPSAPRVAKCHQSAVKLKNYTFPAGRFFIISLYGINRHPMWGADADQFKPERWLDPATLPDNPNAFSSFSLGKRNCIGKQYALMSIKTTLAYFLRRYRVSADISKLQCKCDLFTKPVSGHHISLALRT